ncbi:MAG: ABC transporter permease [Deltaproteobacteria bacterium]|jgi:peptide/nickel transport system permease protein|nr:ABC transporter permease [Deltaproteobacteria bacterium]
MLKYCLKRLCFVLLTLLLSSIIIFVATQVLPGDVAQMILGRFARPEAVEALRVKLGLNEPIAVQYVTWLSNFVQGDWGLSLSTNNSPVAPLVWARLKNSGILALVAFVIYVPGGILLGLWAALRRNKIPDHVISVTSLSLIGLPEFVTGVILIAIFSLKLGWLPPSSSISPSDGFIAILPKLVLPAVTAALVSLAYITRMTRASTVEALHSDYVRTAYLKGLSPRQVLFRHVLRNALMPTVTVSAISIGWLMGGLVVTESLFSYPGLGRLLLFAIQRRDLPLIQATTLLMTAIFCLSNMLADLLYAYLNPKIRYQ